MLARLKSVDRVFAMAVRPGADADSIDIISIKNRLRVRLHSLNPKLVGNSPTTLFGTVADSHQLHIVDRLQAGDVAQRGITASTNEANS
jgi:hypothetical protein